MSNNLAIVNNVVVDKYYLYVNTIDNTLVIVTKQLQDLFVKTKLISSSYIISDLQLKAIEFGIDTILIDNLNFN